MYQIPGQQVSFRVDETERNDLNGLAEELQSEKGKKFSNPKHIVFAMFSKITELENEKTELENKVKSLESINNDLLAEGLKNDNQEGGLLDDLKEKFAE